jgi:thiamine biosynthesis lipoprotein ApbE
VLTDTVTGGGEPLGGAGWTALGTGVALRVSDPAALQAAQAAVEQELEAIDRACSRFRADSDLSLLNARAGRPTQAGPLLLEALTVALGAAAITEGDVDPTVGRALELAGYDRDWGLLETSSGEEAAPRIRARVLSDWRAIRLDREGATVCLPRGMSLDLGATAKAWAADRAAAAAASAAGCGVLVGVGGDIATAGSAPVGGWRIRVTDDHRSEPTAPGQTISISSGGLASSSTAVRRWSHEGHTMHHIIDPRTGLPVLDTWRTVSVAAATCAEANIATTASLVRSQAAPAWLQELGLPARLAGWDGSVVHVGGWPSETEESAASLHSGALTA